MAFLCTPSMATVWDNKRQAHESWCTKVLCTLWHC